MILESKSKMCIWSIGIHAQRNWLIKKIVWWSINLLCTGELILMLLMIYIYLCYRGYHFCKINRHLCYVGTLLQIKSLGWKTDLLCLVSCLPCVVFIELSPLCCVSWVVYLDFMLSSCGLFELKWICADLFIFCSLWKKV